MDFKFKTALITGAAGFIGFHLSKRLLENGYHVTGIDNLNDYYDVSLKEARLEQLRSNPNFSFSKTDLSDKDGLDKLFQATRFDVVMNLAAQAGVRYSLENPNAYV
ncbi:MAG: capsular biosynthesis protein CpsI, partial [Deltaproteobacteria bacterium]